MDSAIIGRKFNGGIIMSLNNSVNTPFPMVYLRSVLLDLTSAIAQPMFTIPSGKSFIALGAINESISIVNYSVDASLYIGTNSPTFDNWVTGGSWFATISGTTYPQGLFTTSPINLVTAGTTVTALFNPPMVADSATGYVYIYGVYK